RQPNLLEQANKWEWLSPGRLYDNAFSGILRFAEFQTKFIQSGYLRNYILIALLTLLVLVAPPLLKGSHLIDMDWNLHLADFALVMVISLGTIAAVSIQSRLAVAVTLGAIGIVVMLIYVTFGAMDLAVTQIMVETLTVILLVLVLYHLPRFVAFSSRWILIRDAVISLLFGCVITILVLKAYMIQPDPSLREYFVEHSYTEAHGRNVVKVILVDFRAMDTMGEITVLAVAGIGVYALLKIRPIRGRKDKK